jgi:FkbM family methyltransferase
MDLYGYALYLLGDLHRARTKNTVFTPDDVLRFRRFELESKINGSRSVDGLTFNYNTRSDMLGLYNEIFLNKIYDFKADNQRPLIIDGGANIGMATLRFKKLYPYSRIVCFEPQPLIFELLQKNLVDNHLRDVAPYCLALTGEEKPLDFYVSTDGVTDCCASVYGVNGNCKKFTVMGAKLSSFITEKVDLLKLDIEGSELPVLRELEASGKLEWVKNMVLEYHPGPGNQDLRPLLELLDDAGFVCDIRTPYDLSGELSRYIYKDGLYFFMIYAVRKECAERITELGSYSTMPERLKVIV